jgi:hypothetical protein
MTLNIPTTLTMIIVFSFNLDPFPSASNMFAEFSSSLPVSAYKNCTV